jgi:pentatricopeptide repeat protein
VVNGILEIIQRRNLSLPDDGTALAVLNFAGNIGNTELASSMIDSLGQQGYQYHEQHFAPLIQAFVKQGDIKKAFSVLEIMRSFSIPATKHTANPILESLDGNLEQIDQAYYILEQIKKEGKEVDTIAFNTVLGACVKARDLHRSISTYQEAAKLGVKPNIDTYNYALDACLLARNRQMGDLILTHMKEANVSPNIATYTKCIMLSCTQSNYEDAFLYLEEMKQYNIIPPRMCYEHLVRKLVRESDPRLKVALEEMETFGLEVTPFLRTYIANKGRPQQQQQQQPPHNKQPSTKS